MFIEPNKLAQHFSFLEFKFSQSIFGFEAPKKSVKILPQIADAKQIGLENE